MNCAASKALLTLYVLKDLDDATAATVRAHLDACPDCRAALQDIDSTLGLLRDALAAPSKAPAHLTPAQRTRIVAPHENRPPRVVSGLGWFTQHHRVLAAAAAIILVAGMIGLLMPTMKSARQKTLSVDVKSFEAPEELDEVVSLSEQKHAQTRKPALPSDRELESRSEMPEFEQVTMVKSPAIMKNILGNRGVAGRAAGRLQDEGASEPASAPVAAEVVFGDDDEISSKQSADKLAKKDRSDFFALGYAHKAKESRVTVSGGEKKKPGKSRQSRSWGEAALKSNVDGNGIVAVDSAVRLRMEERIKRDLSSMVEPNDLEKEQGWRYTAYGVNPFMVTRQQPFSTFGIDVDTASYTLTRNMMRQGTLPPAGAVRTEEFVNAFDYNYAAPLHRTFRIYTELAPSPFGRGLQMLKIGVKGRRLGREEQRPAVLTFLIDTSGSMNAPERIGLVKKALSLLVENLAPNDRVAVIQYDSHARLLLEHTPAAEKARILQVIRRIQCTGSTNLEEGMNEAYRLAAGSFVGGAENRVLILSDGVANLGSMAAEDILKKVADYREQGIFCSVFGVGSGSYDDTMLETLANKGDGVYTFLDSEEQARRVFVDDLAATLNTIASDVKIQVEFNPMIVKQYRQLGYENRQLKKDDFRNDAVDAGEVGSGQSVTALYELDLLPQFLAKTRVNLPPRPLATVRVRYRRMDTGRIEEIERTVWPRDGVATFDKASNGFRLAATVAEFAEILRGSPYAKGRTYDEVADELRPVALALHLDKRVQALLQMVQAAGSTPRSE